jgi:hypothetical protein
MGREAEGRAGQQPAGLIRAQAGLIRGSEQGEGAETGVAVGGSPARVEFRAGQAQAVSRHRLRSASTTHRASRDRRASRPMIRRQSMPVEMHTRLLPAPANSLVRHGPPRATPSRPRGAASRPAGDGAGRRNRPARGRPPGPEPSVVVRRAAAAPSGFRGWIDEAAQVRLKQAPGADQPQGMAGFEAQPWQVSASRGRWRE